jgi:flagellar hook-basal body complex protein FliE
MGAQGGGQMSADLSGIADMGTGGGGAGGGMASGLAPTQPASATQNRSFTDALRTMVIEQPSASRAYASSLGMRFAMGDTSIDPHQMAIASAKAGVEVQMATRTISSAVSAVRTLFQMQI